MAGQHAPIQAYREPYVSAYGRHDLTTQEQQILSQAVTSVGDMMGHRQMSHLARSEDTAVTQAVSSLIYSLPYIVTAALITGGLLVIGFLLLGGDEWVYLMFWLVSWGWCSLHYLSKNREQGLQHSPAGIALAEIESREEVAKYTVDRFIGLLERKWDVNK